MASSDPQHSLSGHEPKHSILGTVSASDISDLGNRHDHYENDSADARLLVTPGQSTPPPRKPDDERSEQGVLDGKVPEWYPFWLGQLIFSIFGCLFLFLTIALPVTLLYSERNHGLFETTENYVYFWRFGPTAIFSIIAIFWSRVELQSRVYMPWIATKLGMPMGSGGYNVDYLQMLPHTVFYQSLRRRHFFLTFIMVTTYFLKAQIVLAPSLFILATVHGTNQVQVPTLSSFFVEKNISEGTSGSTYYNARLIQDFNMPYPFGVSKNVAYQTFKRGTIKNPITAVVDGLFSEVKCNPMKDYKVTWINETEEDNFLGGFSMRVELTFDGCEEVIEFGKGIILPPVPPDPDPEDVWGAWDLLTLEAERRPCSSLPQQHPQFVYYAGFNNGPKDRDSEPVARTAGAVICAPSAWVSKVQVVDDGFNPNVTLLSNQDKTTITSNPWALMKNSAGLGEGDSTMPTGPVTAGFTLHAGVGDYNNRSLYNTDLLMESVMNFTERMGPMSAHSYLRDLRDGEVTGQTTEELYKLKVNQGICIAATVLFGLVTVISFWSIFQSRKAHSIWNRDPATILGSFLFFHSDSLTYDSMADSLSDGVRGRKVLWSHSVYTPVVLRSWARAVFTFICLGLIATLVALLQTSAHSDGLLTVSDEAFVALVWRSIPTLAMLGVALYVSLCDTAIRELSILSILSSRPCQVFELDLSLSDMLGIRALYHSVQLGIPAVTLAQSLAIFCGFLTTTSSILFTSKSLPGSASVHFQQADWFGSRKQLTLDEKFGSGNTGEKGPDNDQTIKMNQYDTAISTVGFLLLHNASSNLTYPENTYADLVFPALAIDDSIWGTGVTVNMTTPAARVHPTCKRIPEKDYKVKLSMCKDDADSSCATITRPLTCPNGTNDYSEELMLDEREKGDNSDLSYFGHVIDSLENPDIANITCDLGLPSEEESILYPTWLVQTYVWGQFSHDNEKIEFMEVWSCNYSWVEIQTDVSLVWTGAQAIIDESNPPVPDNSNIRPWEPAFSLPYYLVEGHNNKWGYIYPSVTPGDVGYGDKHWVEFDIEFKVLIDPWGPLEKEWLGDKSKTDLILDSLHANAALVSSQLANIGNRLQLEEKSVATPTTRAGQQPVSAKILDHKRKRLVQNASVTYVLVIILSMAVIVNAWALLSVHVRRMWQRRSWLADTGLKGLAPEDFSSIPMMGSLLHGSNFFDIRPSYTHLLSMDELTRRLGDRRFRLGWFSGKTKEEVFTVGVLDDDDFVFVREKTVN